MTGRWTPAAVVSLGLALAAPPALARDQVDLALVLTVDCSYSVDQGEYALQIRGLAQAFLDPGVMQAIRAGANHRIVVSVVQWSSAASQVLVLPWTVVGDEASARAVADRIAATPRLTADGGTSISAAIDVAAALLDASPLPAKRRAIDISSDGRNNNGRGIVAARDAALLRGITVNGLAIENEVPTLRRYFELYVIGGEGAFVVTAESYADYVGAIRRKLRREIAGDKISDAGPRPAGAARELSMMEESWR